MSRPGCATVVNAGSVGEVSWHFIDHGQITFGSRHFSQKFTDAESYDVYTFNSIVPAVPHESPASKNI